MRLTPEACEKIRTRRNMSVWGAHGEPDDVGPPPQCKDCPGVIVPEHVPLPRIERIQTVTELAMQKITIADLARNAGVPKPAVYNARKRARAGGTSKAGAPKLVEDYLRDNGLTWDNVVSFFDEDAEPAASTPEQHVVESLLSSSVQLADSPTPDAALDVPPAQETEDVPYPRVGVRPGSRLDSLRGNDGEEEQSPAGPRLCAAWAPPPVEEEGEPEAPEAEAAEDTGVEGEMEMDAPEPEPAPSPMKLHPAMLTNMPLDWITAEIGRRYPGAELRLPL